MGKNWSPSEDMAAECTTAKRSEYICSINIQRSTNSKEMTETVPEKTLALVPESK
ncbi:hypothetical protein ACJMK2_036366 [Sinanodonta woodiana]|uniref:Uncharacterized protein n=1 Tax=Sinanodonta woodiana TaxID=1069815 RepID=A0ABD3WI58_SINWO